MKTIFTVLSAVTLVFSLSCSKEEIKPENDSDLSNYGLLKIGNEWIYETYFVNQEGVENFRTNDTIKIVGDTVINGRKFFIESCSFDGDRCSRLIYEDEKSLRLSPSDQVIFSLDSTQTYRYFETGGSPDTLVVTDFRLIGKKAVLVPAGEFEAFEFSGEAKSQLNSSIVYPKSYYTSGVGLVLKICPFLNGKGNRFEQRLLKYNVEP